ncbi:hypothetical protein BU14_2027s0001 [Porphyra umbilicalis]|uniref:Uncharacterized protein n=1 Tax=Porphyra umbilicalis TaxID=2786 RepID=A0A1X6NK32_PORUM|nr:hypothetical protein BU14_2027s0001 [Porphyra umbilicalis]|eukprot:OSX68967.1 hypothetical protein BU14_2027s0001 [Porphyra umbilicalis]
MSALTRVFSVAVRRAPLHRPADGGRRLASSSPRLPFEKPMFDSPLLDKAREEARSIHKLEMYTNVLIIGLVASITAQVGYFAVNGKPGGADPLPRL